MLASQHGTFAVTAPTLFLLCGAAIAQGDTISAERPGFRTAAGTMAPARFQIEGGVEHQRNDEGINAETTTLPFLVLRAGLTERTELQLSWAGYADQQFDQGSDVDGVNDASIIFKYRASAADAKTPFVLFGALSVPVGDDELTSDGTDPTLGLAWSDASGLFGTFTLASVTDGEADRTTELSGALGNGFSISENLGAYLEYFGTVRDSGAPTHQVNSGLTYLASADLQLDIYLGAGLNSHAPDFFAGAGAAWRW